MKKLTKQLLIVCFVFALIVTMVPVSTANAAVKLNKSKATIEVGKTVTLKVIGTKKKVTWTSSPKKIATVSKKGKVTAKKAGKATITAKVGNKKYTCKVTVIQKASGKDTDKKDDTGGAIGGEDSGKPVISYSGKTVSLKNIGVSIPVLDHFNSEALAGESPDYIWGGDSSVPAEQPMYDGLNAVRDTLIDKGVMAKTDQGFSVHNYAITWDWDSASAVSDFELERVPSKNYYILTINLPLDAYVSSWDQEIAPYNRDIVLSMCSIFSSKPQAVYDCIYKWMYKDASLLSMNKYKSVGDCKIKWGKESYLTDQGGLHIVFYIKAK